MFDANAAGPKYKSGDDGSSRMRLRQYRNQSWQPYASGHASLVRFAWLLKLRIVGTIPEGSPLVG